MLRLTKGTRKQAILLLGTSGIIGSPAFAGSPIPFDNFTVSNGSITAGCPTAASLGTGATSVTCTDGVSDNGMLQREVTISGGTMAGTYIQFITTDPGVSGDGQAVPFSSGRGNVNFVNEDFVRMNNRGDGISSKQTLIDSSMSTPTLEQRFVNSHEYEFGWANSGITPWIHSYQDISSVDYSADPLNPTLTFSSSSDVVSNGIGFNTNIDIGIDQYVDLTDSHGSGTQQFKYKKVGGQYQTTSNPANPVLPGGTNGGNVYWNPFETVSALWVGQEILSPGLASSGLFSHTRYLNETTSSTSALTLLDTKLPTNWSNPPFGPINAITTPYIVAPTAATTAPTGLTATVAASAPASGTTTAVSGPITYDNWTVSNGTFTPGTCPSGYTCGGVIVNERGLFQRLVTDNGTGVEYIQTIVTDTAATGDPTAAPFTAGALAFKNETFVKYRDPTGSPTGTGIATKLHIDQQDLSYVPVSDTNPLPTTGGQFAYDTKIETGWANGGALDPTIVVDQRVYVPDTQFQHSSSMDNTFHMEIGQTQNDKIIDMSTVVGTSAIGSFSATTPAFGAALCASLLPTYQSYYNDP
ncbi:MAG: hypothetical protein GC138_07920, partial [Gammaproteobacteria bacterium]|nr:hypothetical protein [Gammaproteobacteria bacterium]